MIYLSKIKMDQRETFLQGNETSGVDNLHLNDDIKIKEILAEQQKLQILYNEVIAYIQQHAQMSPDEMIKYQTQLKQLSEYYQKNQEKLKMLWYSSVQVNKNVVIKRWAKRNLSLKTFFLGCAAIIAVFVLGLTILSFYLASNPTMLGGFWNLGIQPAVAVAILKGLSLTVMLVILVLGIIILIMNTYKSFTVKNKPKGWYYAWSALGLFILALALGAGTKLLSMVAMINVEEIANPEDVVALYMINHESDGKLKYHAIDGSFPLIAPMNMSASILRNNYRKFIEIQLNALGGTVENFSLDCWNSQRLSFSEKTENFQGACFYTKKGNYPITLIVQHQSPTREKSEIPFVLKTLSIGSEFSLQGVNVSLSGGQNELIVGPLPAEVAFWADQIFRDFNLREYKIEWDGDNDGIPDKTDDTTFHFVYDVSKVYYPRVRLPRLSNVDYSFPLRVEQSGIPVCKIDFQQKKVNDYMVSASFFDGTERFISDYSFLFIDKATGKVFDEVHNKEFGLEFDYRFPGKWSYLIKMNFITNDDKKGSCQNELQLTEKSTFMVNYDLLAISWKEGDFKKIEVKTQDEKKQIPLTAIPTKLKLRFLKLEPKTLDTQVKIYLDQKPIVFANEGEYLFDIHDSKQHQIKIQIQDVVRGLEYEEILTTAIGLEDIFGTLSILGETVGFDPFEVTLDASASRLNDPDDQITYFSWDFWDGEVQKKLSNAVIKHTYRFDYPQDNGTFTPKVTIYTQKGRSVQVVAPTPIIVKKQLVKLDIRSETHPTQEAKLWDTVRFSLDFNGLPKKVSWDFGDGMQAITCEGRTCTEMTKTWLEQGIYLIKVKMDFEDQQSIEQTMEFRVRR